MFEVSVYKCSLYLSTQIYMASLLFINNNCIFAQWYFDQVKCNFFCRRFQANESPPVKAPKRSKKCTILWSKMFYFLYYLSGYIIWLYTKEAKLWCVVHMCCQPHFGDDNPVPGHRCVWKLHSPQCCWFSFKQEFT